MRMLSDHKYRAFGEAFGTFIEGLGLLTRAVFVLDRNGIVRYVDYVENLSAEPEYPPLIAALRSAIA
jgi:thiol peroxidase